MSDVLIMAPAGLGEPLDVLLKQVAPSWQPIIQAWRHSPAGRSLVEYLDQRVQAGAVVYPSDVFRALNLTPLDAVRVVILGQDPYHGPGQAEGLAFSVPPGQRLPPSLRNIFKELGRDLQVPMPSRGHLGSWARQGVLLLNTSLTVEEGRPGSHAKQGWEALTDQLIDAVARHAPPKVFMLWGSHAQAKRERIEAHPLQHLVLQSNHPSPLSATRGPIPFIGNGHFSAANRFIEQHALGAPIHWDI